MKWKKQSRQSRKHGVKSRGDKPPKKERGKKGISRELWLAHKLPVKERDEVAIAGWK